MSRLIESIRLEDGMFHNLEGHEHRMDDSIRTLYKTQKEFQLKHIVKESLVPAKGLFKCRIVYDHKNCDISYAPYTMRVISSLKLREHNEISYPHKFADRSELEHLFQLRDWCDDVLIIKNGMVTDTSYANIVFKSGKEWVTPATCLLKGTMRQHLLNTGQIKEAKVSVKDIHHFEKFKLINAMLGWHSAETDISSIV